MKILILRFSSIGDIVLTTPVLRCIKSQHPEYELHYATKKKFAGLLKNNPHIHHIHELDGNITELISRLRNEKFDVIIDLHKNLRTRMIRSALQVKTYAFDKLNWEKWLMVMFKINLLPYKHIVDRYMDTVLPLHVQHDGKGLEYHIDPSTSLKGHAIPAEYSVYAIGAQHNTKKLPLNKKIELLNKIGTQVLLIGGKEDAEEGENVCAVCSNAVNFCGKLSIDQSALLMKGAEQVYSHDTGMMHIAAALGKTVISIWGNTIPEFGMTPYYGQDVPSDNRILQVDELSCRPCSKIGYNACPKGHFNCMQMQEFGLSDRV